MKFYGMQINKPKGVVDPETGVAVVYGNDRTYTGNNLTEALHHWFEEMLCRQLFGWPAEEQV